MALSHLSPQAATAVAAPEVARPAAAGATTLRPVTRAVPGLLHGPDPDGALADRSAVSAVLRRKTVGAVNRTGLPDQLKAGLESLSGLDVSAIKVHYNSAKPAALNALAYAQGTDIYVAPGQEAHLAHEAWHVVQQMQGRVSATNSRDEPVVDEGLEAEAERMGDKAAGGGPEPTKPLEAPGSPPTEVIQTKLIPDQQLNDLMDDVGVKKTQKDLKIALQKLLTDVKGSVFPIQYDDVVAAVKKVGLNADKIGKIAAQLESRAVEDMDADLSGGRGHMMKEHVATDKGRQTARLKAGKDQVTRVSSAKGNDHRYMNYVETLRKKVPGQLKEHVEDITTRLFRNMQDDGWDALNVGQRKTRLTDLLETLPTTIEYDGYDIDYVWAIKVTGAGTRLTCGPEIKSDKVFRKIETTLDDDEAVESTALKEMNMYWGSNRLVVDGLVPGLTEGEFSDKLKALNFSKLGVTQY